MAELAVTAFAAMGSTAAAGTAAAGTAAAGALGSTALGALSTGMTVAGAASALLGGFMGLRQSQMQASIGELNASQAQIEAEEKATRIRTEMVQKVGQARVAFAGSGLDISSADAIDAGYRAEADFETSLARTSGRMASAGAMIGAETARMRGYAGVIEGAGRAAGMLGQNAISIARRG